MHYFALIGFLLWGTEPTPHQTWTGEPVPEIDNYESVPAKWHQDLESTYLNGYKKGEHLIISSLYTGMHGKDASVKYSLMVKVSAWDKPFSTTVEWPNNRTKETFTVTLHELPDPKEMRAEFDHGVYENGELFLHYAGTSILVREN